MVPEVGKRYVVRPQWGRETASWAPSEVYECYGRDDKYHPCQTWQFGAALPHEGDETRGVSFLVHENDILSEVA